MPILRDKDGFVIGPGIQGEREPGRSTCQQVFAGRLAGAAFLGIRSV